MFDLLVDPPARPRLIAFNWTELDEKTPLGDDIHKYLDASYAHLQIESDKTQSEFLEKFTSSLCDYCDDW